MRCFAPSFAAIRSFSSDDEVTMTVAPDAAANCSPNMDTPPVPRISTVSPPFSGTGPMSAAYAVRAAQLVNHRIVRPTLCRKGITRTAASRLLRTRGAPECAQGTGPHVSRVSAVIQVQAYMRGEDLVLCQHAVDGRAEVGAL